MIRNNLSSLLIAPLLLLAAACVSEDEVRPIGNTSSETTLRLKLCMDSEEAKTETARSDKGQPDDYEQASGTFEQIATLRVIILHNSPIMEVEGARMVATASDGTPINDNLEFKVASNEMKTIVLIANEASLPSPVPGKTTSQFLDQFSPKGTQVTQKQWQQFLNWQVTQSANTSLFANIGDSPRLPLTEIWNINTLQLEETGVGNDEPVQETTLFLTRAAAKATFIFDVDTDPANPYIGSGVKVTGVRLKGLNTAEYVFPANAAYSPAKYIGNQPGTPNEVADGKRFITSFDAVTRQPGYEEGSTFTIGMASSPVEIKSYNGQNAPVRGPIYFPESKMPAKDMQFTVEVELDGNGNWLPAQPLTDNILNTGGLDAIARNTHLEIHIKFGANGISSEVTLVPYIGVNLDPIFGTDRE